MRFIRASAQLTTILSLLLSFSACKSRSTDDSSTKVVNGIEASPTQLRAVVQLRAYNGGLCTAMFLNRTTVLTAAHCLYNFSTSRIALPSIAGTRPVNAFQASDQFDQYLLDFIESPNDSNERQFVKHDIAILVFPPSVFDALDIPQTSLRQIETEAIGVGTPVFVVGYGRLQNNDPGSSRTLRWGTNTLSDVDSDVICIERQGPSVQGTNVVAARGDSGGPLFKRNYGPTGSETIIGVVSSVPIVDQGGACFPNLQSDTAKALFNRAINCAVRPCAEAFSY